jgi:uncharacterized RmlC-like cupin family protein
MTDSSSPPAAADGRKTSGVRVIPGDQPDDNSARTPGTHQEINAPADETLECVLVRSDNEAVVVNLDIEPVETPRSVAWIDPIHRAPG